MSSTAFQQLPLGQMVTFSKTVSVAAAGGVADFAASLLECPDVAPNLGEIFA